MRPSLAELERRHADLLARCAAERELAGAAGTELRALIEPYDATVAKARRWLTSPAVLGAGVMLAWALGRGSGLRRVGNVAALLGTAMRLRALL